MSVPPSAADLDTGERIFAVDLPDDAATGRLAADLALVLGLGDVVALDEHAVVVRTRRGDVTVALTDVVAVRVVPPAPPRRAPKQLP